MALKGWFEKEGNILICVSVTWMILRRLLTCTVLFTVPPRQPHKEAGLLTHFGGQGSISIGRSSDWNKLPVSKNTVHSLLHSPLPQWHTHIQEPEHHVATVKMEPAAHVQCRMQIRTQAGGTGVFPAPAAVFSPCNPDSVCHPTSSSISSRAAANENMSLQLQPNHIRNTFQASRAYSSLGLHYVFQVRAALSTHTPCWHSMKVPTDAASALKWRCSRAPESRLLRITWRWSCEGGMSFCFSFQFKSHIFSYLPGSIASEHEAHPWQWTISSSPRLVGFLQITSNGTSRAKH